MAQTRKQRAASLRNLKKARSKLRKKKSRKGKRRKKGSRKKTRHHGITKAEKRAVRRVLAKL